jgi:exopolysaccharide production protein ExoQ
MIQRLILYSCFLFAIWAIRRDTKLRDGVSVAAWIPTLWAGILASKPLSTWFGGGIGADAGSTLEGSPVDMLFYLSMILLAMVVLSRRQVEWGSLISKNWGVFLFYGFLLVSVAWANSPVVSFKRWFKEFGNILVLLVILTERNPQQAFRAVFVRCSYLLIPLSLVYIRYFPDIGRRYNIHSGEMEAIGVTFQKNSLGAMILVCGFTLIWDWLELRRQQRNDPAGGKALKWPLRMRVIIFLIGIYLLRMCDSKTSLLCLMLSGGILAATRLPLLRQRLQLLGVLGILGAILFVALDQMFGIKQALVTNMGRDMTFTGRTDVWDVLLHVGTDPIIGTGFCSFWDDLHFQAKLPYWVAFSAHNGYIEMYLAGGLVGVSLLAVMILHVGARLNRELAHGNDYTVVRLAMFVAALTANFSESNFAVMTPVGFMFLLVAIGEAGPQRVENTTAAPTDAGSVSEPEVVEIQLDQPALAIASRS